MRGNVAGALGKRFLFGLLLIVIGLYLVPLPYPLLAGQQAGRQAGVDEIDTLFRAANDLFVQRQYRTALNTFRLVLDKIEKAPDRANREESVRQTYLIIAHCHFELGEREQAKAAFVEYLKRIPNIDEDPPLFSEKIGIVYGEARTEYRMMLAQKAKEEAEAREAERIKEEARLRDEARKKEEDRKRGEEAARIKAEAARIRDEERARDEAKKNEERLKKEAADLEAKRVKEEADRIKREEVAAKEAERIEEEARIKEEARVREEARKEEERKKKEAAAIEDARKRDEAPEKEAEKLDERAKLSQEPQVKEEAAAIDAAKKAEAKPAEKSEGQTQPKPVVKTKVGAGDSGKKKGRFPWLIAGGLAVGGAAAVLLLGKGSGGSSNGGDSPGPGTPTTGSIQVNSTPSGARIHLDNVDKGITTPNTIYSVPVGSHSIKLTKEDYRDYSELVNVSGGQTASLNAILSKNTISVTQPRSSQSFKIGETITVNWTTNTSAVSGRAFGMSPSGQASLLQGVRGGLATRADGGAGILARAGEPEGRAQIRDSVLADSAPSAERAASAAPSMGYEARGIVTPKLLRPFRTLGPQAGGSGLPFIVAEAPSVRTQIISKVSIELYKGSTLMMLISSSTSNDGSYSWFIDRSFGLKTGNDYKIVVSSATDSTVRGSSGAFKIYSDNEYYLVKEWGGKGSQNGKLIYPHGISLDRSANLYVCDTGNNRIQKFSSNGAFLEEFKSGNIESPWYIAIEQNGKIYVSFNSYSATQNIIAVFKSNMEPIKSWPLTKIKDGVEGIGLDNRGHLLVCEIGDEKIQKYSTDGNLLQEWVKKAQSWPSGIATDRFGYIYTVWSGIKKFDINGKLIARIGDGYWWRGGQQSIALDKQGNIFATDAEDILKFSSAGELLAKWNWDYLRDHELFGLAVDDNGNVYVSDQATHCIRKYTKKN